MKWFNSRKKLSEDEGSGDAGSASSTATSSSIGSSSELGEPPKNNLGKISTFYYSCPGCATVLSANYCKKCKKNNLFLTTEKLGKLIWRKEKKISSK